MLPAVAAQRRLFWEWIDANFGAPTAEQWALLTPVLDQDVCIALTL
jgi:hypothetical protein